MTRKGRLVFLGLSLIVLILIGYFSTGGFAFLLQQFWFTAGLFLLVLLSLVDQPHFSKDANIFQNGVSAWISLLLVPAESRSIVWWAFLGWSTYLITSSYLLMWIRSRELSNENPSIQLLSRVNRQIGRPEALFSALFLWGCFLQFRPPAKGLNALLLFWAVFMIVNLQVVSQAIEDFLTARTKPAARLVGVIHRLVSPRIAEATLSAELPIKIVGRQLQITKDRTVVGDAIIIDDRFVAGRRIGRLAITVIQDQWALVSADSSSEISLAFRDEGVSQELGESPISVADVGSEIGKLVFHVHPDLNLQSGEVVWTSITSGAKAFYQVVSGQVFQIDAGDGNCIQSVKASAGQLGIWDSKSCRFETVTWVPPAGELVRRAASASAGTHGIPTKHVVVGTVPNSDFPVHVNIEDVITHNTAIIGVTGSGKSYLAFHLIEAMVANDIRVIILDLSRQHFLYLKSLNPTPLKTPADVSSWLASNSLIGIHQYATAAASYPQVTSQFVEEAFKELAKTTLRPGENEPARLCIVFEEAHSIIPEWNQVAIDADRNHVNKTARIILQGRKFGMGSLIITQRTANVTKTILNQCNTIFALQSFDQTGLDFLKNYMGDEYSHAISTLPSRRTILVGKASSSTRPIILEIGDFSERWRSAMSQGDTAGNTELATGEIPIENAMVSVSAGLTQGNVDSAEEPSVWNAVIGEPAETNKVSDIDSDDAQERNVEE